MMQLINLKKKLMKALINKKDVFNIINYYVTNYL